MAICLTYVKQATYTNDAKDRHVHNKSTARQNIFLLCHLAYFEKRY